MRLISLLLIVTFSSTGVVAHASETTVSAEKKRIGKIFFTAEERELLDSMQRDLSHPTTQTEAQTRNQIVRKGTGFFRRSGGQQKNWTGIAFSAESSAKSEEADDKLINEEDRLDVSETKQNSVTADQSSYEDSENDPE